MSSLRVAVLIGSLRATSLNRRLFEHAVTVAPDGIELFEVPIDQLPLYNEDLRADDTEGGFPEPVRELRAALRSADAALLIGPEYNYSIAAPLKNALDWASRAPDKPFVELPVAIMGATGGRLGTARMQYELRRALVALDARALSRPEVMVAGARAQFGDGMTPEAATTQLVIEQLEALRAWTEQLRR